MTPAHHNILILPGVLAEEDLDRVSSGLELHVGLSEADAEFEILDNHVGSLLAAGQLLMRAGKTLILLEDRQGMVTQSSSPEEVFVADLKAGPVKDALQYVPPLRSLLRVGSGTVCHRDLSVTDDENKTVVRARLMTLRPDGGGRPVTIAALYPLRGYDKALRQLRAHLQATAESASPATSELSPLLFPDQPQCRPKPYVAIVEEATAWLIASDIIATYLQVARGNEKGIIADHDTEFLHDYRVALRKVRSVLSLFKGVYPEEQTTEFKRSASALMSATARLRDLDVYLLSRDDYFAMLPPSLHQGLSLMFEMFHKERRAAHSTMSSHLNGAAYQSAITDLQAAFAAADGLPKGPMADVPVGDYAGQLIWKRYRKVCCIAREITAKTPDAQIHELRIGCKKLRYLIEFFAPLYPKTAIKPILKPLKRLQDNLGLFNDYSVQQTFLQSFMRGHKPLRHKQDLVLAQSIGALIAVLHERQKEERARIMASFSQFDGTDIRNQFRTLFNVKEA